MGLYFFFCYFSLFALAAFSIISFACFCPSLASLDGVFGISFAQPLSFILFLSFLSFASFLHLQNLSFWLPLDFCCVYLLLPYCFSIFICSACLVMLYLFFFCFNFLACVSSVCFGQHFHLCLFYISFIFLFYAYIRIVSLFVTIDCTAVAFSFFSISFSSCICAALLRVTASLFSKSLLRLYSLWLALVWFSFTYCFHFALSSTSDLLSLGVRVRELHGIFG